MTTIRLPKRVMPRDGESLGGLIERIAAEHGSKVTTLTEAAGVGYWGNPIKRASYVVVTDEEERLLAAATRLPREVIRATTLRAYEPILTSTNGSPKLGKAVRTSQADHRRRKWCPACLAEPEGTWLLHWHLALTVACLRHGCLMAARCAMCGEHPSAIVNSRPGERLCPYNTRRGARCLAPLAQTSTLPAPRRVLDAQRRLHLAVTTGTAEITGVHMPVSALVGTVTFIAVQMVVLRMSPFMSLLTEMAGTHQLPPEVSPGSPLDTGRPPSSGDQKRHGFMVMRHEPIVAAAAITAATEAVCGDGWAMRLLAYTAEHTVATSAHGLRNPLMALPEQMRGLLRDGARRQADLAGRLSGAPPMLRPHSQVWAAANSPAQQ